METVLLMSLAAPPIFLAGGLAVVQARLAALYPNPESHPGSGRSGALECFAFVWSGKHRRIRDRALSQAVLASRWATGVAVVLFAGVIASGVL